MAGYKYDPNGERISKTTLAGTTMYAYEVQKEFGQHPANTQYPAKQREQS